MGIGKQKEERISTREEISSKGWWCEGSKLNQGLLSVVEVSW